MQTVEVRNPPIRSLSQLIKTVQEITHHKSAVILPCLHHSSRSSAARVDHEIRHMRWWGHHSCFPHHDPRDPRSILYRIPILCRGLEGAQVRKHWDGLSRRLWYQRDLRLQLVCGKLTHIAPHDSFSSHSSDRSPSIATRPTLSVRHTLTRAACSSHL